MAAPRWGPWLLTLTAILANIAPALSAAACQAPYAGAGSFDWQVAPGEVRQFAANLTIPAGQRVLVEGNLSVAGGLTIHGQLFLSSTDPSTLAADWVAVESGGSLQAGSAACPLPPHVTATIQLRAGSSHPVAGRKALAVMQGGTLELHGGKGLDTPWTRLGATAAAGATTLQLSTGATASWAPGDQLVIASTDYDPYQTERVTVVSVAGARVQIKPPLQFMHYGEVTEGVDERAEVGLLSRSIRIVGAADLPGIGCHTIAYEGFAAYRVEGVELSNCGQADVVGRYPIHLHMAARVPEGTYVRSCSVHDSNFRAVTLHGVQGVLVESTVAADVAGHAFFLEDGSEVGNTLRGNLGLLVRAKVDGARLGSDRTGPNGDLSVYWITNPDNTFEGNAAAATEGWGFFIHTRLAPRGLSAARWPAIKPYRTPLRRFAGNSAHSCRVCLEMEADATDGGDVPPVEPNSPPANWQPRNADGSYAETLIQGFTCHHSFASGFWARLGGLRLVDTAWADHAEAVQFASTGDHAATPAASHLQNAILVGHSGNRGDPSGDPRFQRWDQRLNRSAVRLEDMTAIATGFTIYDGPIVLSNLTARAWPPGTSPLALRSYNIFQMAAGTSIRGFKAERSSYRFVAQDTRGDGGRTASLLDLDGSLSGHPGATVLPHSPAISLGFYSAPGCESHPAYGLACPQRYINLEVGAWDWTGGGAPAGVTLTRANLSPGNVGAAGLAKQRLGLQGFGLAPKAGRGGQYYNAKAAVHGVYLLSFGGSQQGTGTPARAFLQCSSCQPGDEVEAVLCLPPGSTLGPAGVTAGSVEFLRSDQDAAQAAAPGFPSLAAMRAASGSGSRYFHDVAAGLLFLRVRQVAGWGGQEPTGYCPPGGCAWVVANIAAAAGAAAPGPDQCEARLAAAPGGAVSDAAADPFLSARLAPPVFDLAATCPGMSSFGCDCWGWVGCANRECSAAERTPCDTAGGSGNGDGGSTPRPPSPQPPSPKPPAPSAKPPSPRPPAPRPKPLLPQPPHPSPPSPPSQLTPPGSPAACASLSAGGDCCAAKCFAQANPNIQAGASFLAYSPKCIGAGGLGCTAAADGCRFCRLADAATQPHLPACPACVCKQYNLPAARCDPSGMPAAAAAGPSHPSGSKPPSPRPRPSPRSRPSPRPPTPSPNPQRPPPRPPPRPRPPPSPRPPPPVPRPPQPIQWGEPILVEGFNGGSLNRSLWDVEVDCWGGGNAESQCYVDRPENLRLTNGRLIIEARRGDYTGSYENCTNNAENSCGWTKPFTSARIRTKLSPNGSWRYGRIEVRAQMPRGDFLWPAIWMLPTDSVYGTWAASGEIDLLEYHGQAGFSDVIEGSLHYGATWPSNAFVGSGRVKVPGVDFAAGMHSFALEWTSDAATGRPAGMRWLVDGRPFFERRLDVSWRSGDASPYTQDGQPWDQRFHLILNLAVGGGYFPAAEFGPFATPQQWDAAVASWSRPRLEVEYVKVWAWPPQQAAAGS